MAQKAQVVGLVDPVVADMLDELRIVMGEPRAEVIRLALDTKPLEIKNVERLARLAKLAARYGLSRREFALRYSKVYARLKYGPSLERLEDGDDFGTGFLAALEREAGEKTAPVEV